MSMMNEDIGLVKIPENNAKMIRLHRRNSQINAVVNKTSFDKINNNRLIKNYSSYETPLKS